MLCEALISVTMFSRHLDPCSAPVAELHHLPAAGRLAALHDGLDTDDIVDRDALLRVLDLQAGRQLFQVGSTSCAVSTLCALRRAAAHALAHEGKLQHGSLLRRPMGAHYSHKGCMGIKCDVWCRHGRCLMATSSRPVPQRTSGATSCWVPLSS